MKIRFAPLAIEDLEAAVAFIAERNPSAAARLADRVFAVIDTLAEGQFEGPESVMASGERVRSWPVAPLRVYTSGRLTRSGFCVSTTRHAGP